MYLNHEFYNWFTSEMIINLFLNYWIIKAQNEICRIFLITEDDKYCSYMMVCNFGQIHYKLYWVFEVTVKKKFPDWTLLMQQNGHNIKYYNNKLNTKMWTPTINYLV